VGEAKGLKVDLEGWEKTNVSAGVKKKLILPQELRKNERET